MIYKEKEFVVKDNLKVILKTPELSEAKELLNFIIDVSKQTNYLLTSSEDLELSVEDEENWLKSNTEGNDYFFCAYIDGKIVGDCNLNFKTHKKDRHRAVVGVVIDKEYWNKGIGSLMFDEIINLARKSDGIEQLELSVNANNLRAKHLYEKKGFVKTGCIPRALKIDDKTYDDMELMVKVL